MGFSAWSAPSGGKRAARVGGPTLPQATPTPPTPPAASGSSLESRAGESSGPKSRPHLQARPCTPALLHPASLPAAGSRGRPGPCPGPSEAEPPREQANQSARHAPVPACPCRRRAGSRWAARRHLGHAHERQRQPERRRRAARRRPASEEKAAQRAQEQKLAVCEQRLGLPAAAPRAGGEEQGVVGRRGGTAGQPGRARACGGCGGCRRPFVLAGPPSVAAPPPWPCSRPE